MSKELKKLLIDEIPPALFLTSDIMRLVQGYEEGNIHAVCSSSFFSGCFLTLIIVRIIQYIAHERNTGTKE